VFNNSIIVITKVNDNEESEQKAIQEINNNNKAIEEMKKKTKIIEMMDRIFTF